MFFANGEVAHREGMTFAWLLDLGFVNGLGTFQSVYGCVEEWNLDWSS